MTTMKKTYICPNVEMDELGTEAGILASVSLFDDKLDVKGDYDDGVEQMSKQLSFDAFGMDEEE